MENKDFKMAMISIVTANANYLKQDILESNKTLEEKEEVLETLKESTKNRIKYILLNDDLK